METLKQFIQYAPQVAAFLVIFVAGGGYALKFFNKDSREEKSDVVSSANTIMEFWKNQAEQYKLISDEKEKSYSEKINNLIREVGELRGQLTAETAQKKEYLAILQNRDPETKKFMEIMLEFVKEQTETNLEITKVLSDIHKTTNETA